MKSAKTVILAVTGSIAAYKACEIISLLKKASVDINVVLTEEGAKFITPLTLQTLSCNKVFTDMFAIPEEWDPMHISLANKADLILIAPATAGIIGKLACGICDSLLSCVVYATKAPVLIAPAMNSNMYQHVIVKENISRLKKIGYKFVDPVEGRLVCGAYGVGRLADPEKIVSEAKRLLK